MSISSGRGQERPVVGPSTYATLCGLLDFIDAPYVLEVFDGASHGISPRDSVPSSVDDDAVIAAVCRLLADGVAEDVGLGRRELVVEVPRLSERGRRLHEALENLCA